MATTTATHTPAVLFERYHGTLRGRVRQIVKTSEANVEDACMFAWVQLIRHEVNADAAYSWLLTVAVREAVKLDRRSRRTVALASTEDGELLEPVDDRDQILARELTLDTAGLIRAAGLTRRQAQMLGMQVWGLSYQEISDLSGDSLRTVERQLLGTRRKLAKARKARGG